MKQRDIISLVKKGIFATELEYETALSADRTLRILAKSDPSLKELRAQLRGLIAEYEKNNWSDVEKVTEEQIALNDQMEKFAESERRFIEQRKKLILARLKKLKLSQQEFGLLLGHQKSYISELLNGIRPFSQKDLILIHRLLKINLENLIFVLIPADTQKRIQGYVANLENVKLKRNDLELITV
jgi:transcriptional regulator with XRE-family HTH domain